MAGGRRHEFRRAPVARPLGSEATIRRHKGTWDNPATAALWPVSGPHCAELHWWNANPIRAGAEVQVLRRECNYQWWISRAMDGAPPKAILHFSGWMGTTDSRVAEMRKWS
jgi:hypothetical protein